MTNPYIADDLTVYPILKKIPSTPDPDLVLSALADEFQCCEERTQSFTDAENQSKCLISSLIDLTDTGYDIPNSENMIAGLIQYQHHAEDTIKRWTQCLADAKNAIEHWIQCLTDPTLADARNAIKNLYQYRDDAEYAIECLIKHQRDIDKNRRSFMCEPDKESPNGDSREDYKW